MRLFLAIEMEQAIRDALAGAVGTLRQTRAPVKWVDSQAMHLTLKFLGETSPEQARDLKEALRPACRALPPFTLEVAGMGAFPTLNRPRVVWAGANDPSGTLDKLWKAVEDAAAACGWEREKRGSAHHVTVGRVKGAVNLSRLSQAIGGLQDAFWGRLECGEVVLFESFLGPEGARYEAKERFKLGAGSA